MIFMCNKYFLKMFALRFWRINMMECSLLNIVRYSVNSKIKILSEPIYFSKAHASYNKFKCHSYTSFAALKCWNCHTVLDTRPSLFCKNCTLIQSSEQQSINYFELFEIHEQYDIDTMQLSSTFRKLQNLMHPDKFSNKTEEEKILSESFSSLINKAYKTLSNPLLRGIYMLNIHGLSIEEDSVTMDTQFLGEIIEWNEQVEEANTKESIENLKMNIDIILVNLYKKLSKAFNENNLVEAKVILSKAKYFSSMLQSIKEKDI